MEQRSQRKKMRLGGLLAAGLLGFSLLLPGCDGSDGAPGPAADTAELERLLAEAEAARDQAVAASAGDANALESCKVCHGAGSAYDPAMYTAGTGHAIEQRGATTTVTAVTHNLDDTVTITANVKLNGVNNDNFTTVVSAASYTEGSNPTGGAPDQLRSLSTNVYASNPTGTAAGAAKVAAQGGGSGNYTITLNAPTGWVYDGIWEAARDTTYMVRLKTADAIYPEANIVANRTTDGEHVRNLVGNAGCIQCHGTNIFKEEHASQVYHNSAFSSQSCVTCHTHQGRNNLMAYAHGIHNAANMPARKLTDEVTKPAGVYARSSAIPGTSETNWYETTYPTYMNNCSVCHDSDARLAAVNAAPVSYELCMSCHDSWAGFKNEGATFKSIHNDTALAVGSDCSGCHTSFKPTVSAMHNGLFTERNGLIWNGADVSVTEGAKVAMAITGVSYDGGDLKITWTAEYDGTAVNPCNTTVAVGAPIFHAGGAANAATGQANGNLSFLRGYAQGDDWVNANLDTNPGQAPSTNVTTSNTVCAANVATTTITPSDEEKATAATKGVLALQGKAQVKLGFQYATGKDVVQVRSKTPTREYVIGTGAAPAQARRTIIDSEKCLGCHVGSLYQHGGNRIDNVDMCVLCHNEASNEKNNRVSQGVDASVAYDGKAGQTYGFKSLLHAIHSTDRDDGPITMVYRTRGIYVWAGKDTVIPNWPGTGSQTIYGSNPAGDNPNGTTQNHYLHSPTYPRKLQECTACHAADSYDVPDQAISVATTVDAGTAPWGNQVDDVLISTGTATCTSCHQLSSTRAHAYQNSFSPKTFSNGRQTILDAAK